MSPYALAYLMQICIAGLKDFTSPCSYFPVNLFY